MKTIVTQLFLVTLLTGLSAQNPIPPSGMGSGRSPYLIESWENLYWLSQTPEAWNKDFRQTADVVFPLEIINWDEGKGWKPIGYYNSDVDFVNFSGNYNGMGFTISGLFIDRTTNNIGLFGRTLSAKIENVALENVNMKGNNYVGGLVGYNYGTTISGCYTTGSVQGGDNVGGLIGFSRNGSVVFNCYSRCAVSGSEDVGGLLGNNNYSAEVDFCYSTGKVSANLFHGGGLIGVNQNEATVHNSFWDTETSEKSESAGGTAKTTAQMKNIKSYQPLGGDYWDFDASWQFDLFSNEGYPSLQVFGTYGIAGKGTELSPFEMASWEDLVRLSETPYHWDKYFIQMENIAFPADILNWDNGSGMHPIGNAAIPFSGSYEGSQFEITNLYINRDGNFVGFFGKTNGASITHLNVSGDVTGSVYVGMLCGLVEDTHVEKCSAKGTLENTGHLGIAGGFVGVSTGGSLLTNCFSRCAVTLQDDQEGMAGGFVGFNNASRIQFSYSTGTVTDGRYCRGFISVGENSEGLFFRNFYDSEQSGHTDTYGATPLTTMEMLDFNSYPGWDFTNTWTVDPDTNNGYPSFNLITTKIPDFALQVNAVSPNPFSDYLHFNNPSEVELLTIINMSGQVVWQSLLNNSANLNTSFLNSGIYIVQIEYVNGDVDRLKMIKN